MEAHFGRELARTRTRENGVLSVKFAVPILKSWLFLIHLPTSSATRYI